MSKLSGQGLMAQAIYGLTNNFAVLSAGASGGLTLEQIIKQETRSLDKNMILTEVVKQIGTFEKFESGVNTIVIKRSNNIQNVAVGKASVISKILTEEGALSTTEVGAISIKRSDLLNKKKQTQKNPLKAKMYQKRQALALAAKNKSKD